MIMNFDARDVVGWSCWYCSCCGVHSAYWHRAGWQLCRTTSVSQVSLFMVFSYLQPWLCDSFVSKSHVLSHSALWMLVRVKVFFKYSLLQICPNWFLDVRWLILILLQLAWFFSSFYLDLIRKYALDLYLSPYEMGLLDFLSDLIPSSPINNTFNKPWVVTSTHKYPYLWLVLHWKLQNFFIRVCNSPN